MPNRNVVYPGWRPRLGRSIGTYTSNKIKECFLFASGEIDFLVAQPEPLFGVRHLILNHYRELCSVILECPTASADTVARKDKLVREFYSCDLDWHGMMWQVKAPPGLASFTHCHRDFVALGRHQILQRYGVQVSQFWTWIKQVITAQTSDLAWPTANSAQVLGGLAGGAIQGCEIWLKVREVMEQELEIWQQYGTSLGLKEVRISYILQHTANFQQVPHWYLMRMVRIATPHCQQPEDGEPISDVNPKGRLDLWSSQTLLADYVWVFYNYPADKTAERAMLLFWLQLRISDWFEIRPHEPQLKKWIPSASLLTAEKLAEAEPPSGDEDVVQEIFMKTLTLARTQAAPTIQNVDVSNTREMTPAERQLGLSQQDVEGMTGVDLALTEVVPPQQEAEREQYRVVQDLTDAPEEDMLQQETGQRATITVKEQEQAVWTAANRVAALNVVEFVKRDPRMYESLLARVFGGDSRGSRFVDKQIDEDFRKSVKQRWKVGRKIGNLSTAPEKNRKAAWDSLMQKRALPSPVGSSVADAILRALSSTADLAWEASALWRICSFTKA